MDFIRVCTEVISYSRKRKLHYNYCYNNNNIIINNNNNKTTIITTAGRSWKVLSLLGSCALLLMSPKFWTIN